MANKIYQLTAWEISGQNPSLEYMSMSRAWTFPSLLNPTCTVESQHRLFQCQC